MPKAFASAGWLLSLVVVVLLAFMSFVTVTFVIESMSIANYYVKRENRSDASSCQSASDGDDEADANSSSETSRLLHQQQLYDITHRVELGTMARAFLPKLAVRFFYTAIAVYLYGDLVIYSAAISKSLRDITWLVTSCDSGVSPVIPDARVSRQHTTAGVQCKRQAD